MHTQRLLQLPRDLGSRLIEGGGTNEGMKRSKRKTIHTYIFTCYALQGVVFNLLLSLRVSYVLWSTTVSFSRLT